MLFINLNCVYSCKIGNIAICYNKNRKIYKNRMCMFLAEFTIVFDILAKPIAVGQFFSI